MYLCFCCKAYRHSINHWRICSCKVSLISGPSTVCTDSLMLTRAFWYSFSCSSCTLCLLFFTCWARKWAGLGVGCCAGIYKQGTKNQQIQKQLKKVQNCVCIRITVKMNPCVLENVWKQQDLKLWSQSFHERTCFSQTVHLVFTIPRNIISSRRSLLTFFLSRYPRHTYRLEQKHYHCRGNQQQSLRTHSRNDIIRIALTSGTLICSVLSNTILQSLLS